MTSENVISLFIIYPIILILFGIGITQSNQKKPCGFWTGIKPPKPNTISDVKSFNKKVGKLWMSYAIALLISTFFPLFFKSKIFEYFFGFILIVGFIVIGICYQLLLKQYNKK